MAIACLLALPLMLQAAPPLRTIGIEGDVSVLLPHDDYAPRALDDRTPLQLRVEKIMPAEGGGFRYDIHYIGFEPGDYLLSEYLVRPDGSLATEIGDQFLHVESMLPANHDGSLSPYVPQPLPWFGGYRMALGLAGVLWVGGLVGFMYLWRKREPVIEEEEVVTPPTFAERVLPFVEAAAAGKLSAAGQAELERMLTGYWREKLAAPGQRVADAMLELRRHEEAGALLRALERWLHRPAGATREEIQDFLEPYRRLAQTESVGEEVTV